MAKKIYLIGGSKGGVGKSMVSMATIDYLQEQGESILLIESDTSNPDVWKGYHDSVATELVNLDEADGWIQLINLCDSNQDSIVVINTAARNNTGVSAYGTTLNSTLAELKRDLVTLWVINRQRDSLELLKDYMDAIPTPRACGQKRLLRRRKEVRALQQLLKRVAPSKRAAVCHSTFRTWRIGSAMTFTASG
jgi:hypothetical protein